MSEVETDYVLLLGITGGGKSSIANTMLATPGKFPEGGDLKSETYRLQQETGRWWGTGSPVTVIDTPGFLDSEGRSKDFLERIIAMARSFPRDKLRLVIITIPLTAVRADSSYGVLLDEVELLLGEEFSSHTVFVTTHQNKLRDQNLARQKMLEWEERLKTAYHLPPENVKMCNYVHGQPESLAKLEKIFLANQPFTPEVCEKIDLVLQSNLHASVADCINGVEMLQKLKEDHDARIKELIAQKEEAAVRLREQENLSARLEKRLAEEEKEINNLKTALAAKPSVQEVHHHHGDQGGCNLI